MLIWYCSLSLTGKGHLTDKIMQKTFVPVPCDFSFKSGELPYHPNGMLVTVYCDGEALKPIEAYSIGGGEIYFKGDLEEEKVEDQSSSYNGEKSSNIVKMKDYHFMIMSYVLKMKTLKNIYLKFLRKCLPA